RAGRDELALLDAADALGRDFAAGVHAREVEIEKESVSGPALHVTNLISARAAGGEVLVSGVVADLVAGSGLHFSERGSAAIDGLESPLRLLAVASEQHLESAPHARPNTN